MQVLKAQNNAFIYAGCQEKKLCDVFVFFLCKVYVDIYIICVVYIWFMVLLESLFYGEIVSSILEIL